jgi:lipopolysaccharide/colanic/teichoic acid biosynthesis glycosyltransferase
VNKIVYIGENSHFKNWLSNSINVELTHVANVVGFHNNLSKLEEYDLVIADARLKGLDGLGIFERYKQQLNNSCVPFGLVINHPEKSIRLDLLKTGITEVFAPNERNGEVTHRVGFLKEMLNARLSQAEKPKFKEYQIPVSKRIFDIIVAGFALVILSPILILTAIALKLESKGPIWYVSKRVGTGYKVFDFYKFRSMYVDADQRIADMKHLNQYAIDSEGTEPEENKEPKKLGNSPTLIYKDGQPMSEEEYLMFKRKQQAGTFVKFKNDPRITKVGRFIRNTSIDELPQLINVLKGDMSIVGNRPLPLYEAEQLTSDDWGERFLAPAGITGLWQVMKRGKGEMSEDERKGLDNQYARKVSLWNDIRLILKTIPALFQKENV